jgi:RHS repeat-associated protein
VYKFTGKQRDAETGGVYPVMLKNGNYFGARYYMPRYGRWGQTEPLYDKYISYTPYQYGLLNPMRLVDPKGKDVRATTYETQQMILNTIPKDLRSYVIFDKNGYIDKKSIEKIISKSSNYEALKKLVTDSRLYDVIIANSCEYKNKLGESKTYSLGKLDYALPHKKGNYELGKK